jgi:hypothetical protein
MPQPILPLFSDDMTIINGRFAVIKKKDVVFWFQGSLPVFRHHVNNQAAFRSFCCQLINLGNATSAEISRALNVNHEKLSRWARLEPSPDNFDSSSSEGKSSKRIKKKPMF